MTHTDPTGKTRRYRVVSDDHSNHGLPIGAHVEHLRYDAEDDVDLYTMGGEGDEVAIDPRDLYMLAGADLACDFCGGLHQERDDLMIVEFETFQAPTLNNYSPLWAACFRCSALIADADWKGLLDRSEECHSYRGQRTIASPPVNTALASAYEELRRHLKAGPRRWQASDYAEPEVSP
jgi:hypothetical protein